MGLQGSRKTWNLRAVLGCYWLWKVLYGSYLNFLAEEDTILFDQTRGYIPPCPSIPYVSNGLGRDLEVLGQREDLSTTPKLHRA